MSPARERAHLAARLEEIDSELAAMDEADREVVGIESGESRSSKRRRK